MLRIVETGEGREAREGAVMLDEFALDGARRMLAAASDEEVGGVHRAPPGRGR